MATLWFDATGLVPADPTLQVTYSPAAPMGSVAVGATAVGSSKWVRLGTALALPARVESLTVCYQIVSAADPPSSRVEETRLLATTSPGGSSVIFDDSTPLASKTAVCLARAVGQDVHAGAIELDLRLSFGDVKDQIVVSAVAIVATDLCLNQRDLSEFGDYQGSDPAKPAAAFAAALAQMTAAGTTGGALSIPRDTTPLFVPRNRQQGGVDQPAVTVIDSRGGCERLFVPPIGTPGSSGTIRGSRILERDLATNLLWQDVFSTELIQSRYYGGASSYAQELQQPVAAGKGVKFYLPTLRGLFVGQQLLVKGAAADGSEDDFVIVQMLGVDATAAFFTADAAHDHLLNAEVYNKNEINGLTIADVSNCDNQSESLLVDRTTYGDGDSFAVSAILNYQGDIVSSGGDEGGIGVAAAVQQDLACFWGVVESWTPATGELVYAAGSAELPQKLGTSRPLINMNDAKLRRQGMATVRLGDNRIIGDENVEWDASLVGRFFAFDDASEYYDAGEPNGLTGGTGHVVHRFWRIASFATSSDGPTLQVERAGYLPQPSAPVLLNQQNFGTFLRYIIAPGAWVSDVRRGVAGDLVGRLGQAKSDDPRTLVLAPAFLIDEKTPVDFAPGDPITNAVGPAPFQPTAVRARHFESLAPIGYGCSFLAENWGRVQVGAALHINGVPPAPEGAKDGLPPFGAGVEILAKTHAAIKIVGAVEQSAIELFQPQGNLQPIRWYLNEGTALLYASPTDGAFTFVGGALDFGQKSSRNQWGLSATAQEAANLRGIGVAVDPHDPSSLRVTFDRPEPDATYALFLQCSWQAASSVTKTAQGFDAAFSPAAPAGGTVDWLLVR